MEAGQGCEPSVTVLEIETLPRESSHFSPLRRKKKKLNTDPLACAADQMGLKRKRCYLECAE